jgi:hypothetical protein
VTASEIASVRLHIERALRDRDDVLAFRLLDHAEAANRLEEEIGALADVCECGVLLRDGDFIRCEACVRRKP